MPRRDSDYTRLMKGKKPRSGFRDRVSFELAKVGAVEPPRYLDEFAMAHWKRMVHILAEAKLFQAPSRDKLARYCQACADYETVQEMRTEMGAREKHLPTKENRGVLYFWLKCMKDYDNVMRNFEQEYGLTPAAATKICRPAEVVKPADNVLEFVGSKPTLT